ncbi:MAG: zinc ribbon domain-containing protein [Chloroflexi bacterium]|nr:zinc ribbon domain-containing protein [Chloroflexota bacterium]
MKKILTILIALAALASANSAQAQETITLNRMVIEIWPEYDRREALVIYSGQVIGGVTLPLTLSITLPQTAELNAVAYPAAAGLLQADYTVEGNTVQMTTQTGLFHIEFYDPAFAYAEQQRSYALTYTADYPTNELIWSIQQPPEASTFQADPAPAVTTVNNAGLTVAEGSTQGLQPGDPFALSFAYTRPSDDLVVDTLAVQSGAESAAEPQIAPPTTTTGSGGLSTPTVIALVVGVGLLAAAGIYVVTQGGPRAALESIGMGGRRRHTPQPTASRQDASRSVFCTQCGERISSDDRFCRHCGAAV